MNRNEAAKAVVDSAAAGSTTAFPDVGVVKRRVTGDSLSTDHSIDPPVWSGRSRGRFNPSNLPTAPAHGDRRDRPVRRLRTLSLPALGVAAGLPAVFLALPAPRAHAQAPALVEVDHRGAGFSLDDFGLPGTHGSKRKRSAGIQSSFPVLDTAGRGTLTRVLKGVT